MTIVESLAQLFEPWKSTYGDSVALSTTIVTLHVLSLVVGGGLAIAADRATLRVLHRPVDERRRHLEELRGVHHPVQIAGAVLFLSGLLMAAADVETYLTSWIFWLKMALIALLVVNGGVLMRSERGLREMGGGSSTEESRLWARMRLASLASVALWLLTAIVGEVLTNAA